MLGLFCEFSAGKGKGKSKLAKGIRASRMGKAENRTLEMGIVVNHWMNGFICAGSVSVGDEQMSAHDNHFIYSNGMLPSLGAKINRRVKLCRFLISPYDRHYRSIRNGSGF